MRKKIYYLILFLALTLFSACRDEEPIQTTIGSLGEIILFDDFPTEYEIFSDEPNWLNAIDLPDDGSFTINDVTVDLQEVNMNSLGSFDVTFTVTDLDGEPITKIISITIVGSYTISFDSNGGSEIESITLNYGDEITLVTPTKDHHQFIGWYEDIDLTEEFTETTMPANDLTLYAKWQVNQYQINFYTYNGHTEGPQIYDYQDPLNLPVPTREGYTFVGWYRDDKFTQRFTDTTMPGEVLNLFAKWSTNAYTFSIVTNNDETIDDTVIEYGDLIELPTLEKTGYTFAGWYSDKDFRNEYIDLTMPASNLTLYAKWDVITYTISFETDGGKSIFPIDYNYGEDIELPIPERTEATFIGWYLDAGYNTPFTNTKMPANDVTLYAKWDVNEYTISFNTGEGAPLANKDVEYGASLDLPTSSRYGYTFEGWCVDEDCSLLFTDTTMPASNLTLHAKWEVGTYSITFDTDGPTINEISGLYMTEVTLPIPEKDGYLFGGWYTDNTFTHLSIVDSMPGENITVYAKWNILSDDLSTFIEDDNLEYAIRSELGIISGPITLEDASYLTYLDASEMGIESLEGIQYFTNLEFLELDNNNITDINPLYGLNHLNYLNARYNVISDVRVLKYIFNTPRNSKNDMTILNFGFGTYIDYNPLDLTPGGDTYDVLFDIYKKGYDPHNRILTLITSANIEELTTTVELNSQTSGEFISISDVGFYKLTLDTEKTVTFYTKGNLSTDIQVLSDDLQVISPRKRYHDRVNDLVIMTLQPGTYYINVMNAKEYYYSDYNSQYTFHVDEFIEDTSSPIIDFTDSTIERLVRDQLGILDGDIRESDLMFIQALNLYYVQLTTKDLELIGKMENLDVLIITDSNITDLSFLVNVTNLRTLVINNTSINDFSQISSLTSLRILSLVNTNLTSLSDLSTLTNLEYIELMNNDLTNIDDLLTMYQNGCFGVDNMITLGSLYKIGIEDDSFTSVEEGTQIYTVIETLRQNDVFTDIDKQIYGDDHGDDFTSATLIDVNSTTFGTLTMPTYGGTDYDILSFEVTERSIIHIEGTIYFEIYDQQFNNIYYSTEHSTDKLLNPGTYYIKVCEWYAQTINYRINVSQTLLDDTSPIIDFSNSDPNLVAVIRAELGIGIDEPITAQMLETISKLNASFRSISSIEGIEYLVNLRYLNLYRNLITDITPLQDLMHLRSLEISYNPCTFEEGSANYVTLTTLYNRGVDIDIYWNVIPDDYPNNIEEAVEIPINTIIDGTFEYSNDRDFFMFTITEESSINIKELNGNINYQLFYNNMSFGEDFIFLLPGTYQLRIKGGSSIWSMSDISRDYQFMIEVEAIDQSSPDVTFNDQNLQQVIEKTLIPYTVVPEVFILREAHLSLITVLDAYESNISDITGIDRLINLEYAILSNNHISDITPLLNLNNLKMVDLIHNAFDLSDTTIQNQITDLYEQGVEIDVYDVITAQTVLFDSVTDEKVQFYEDDWFKLEVTTQTAIYMYTTGLTRTNGVIYDNTLQEIMSSVYIGENNFEIVVLLEPGTYYIQVGGRPLNGNYDYQLHLEQTEVVKFADSTIEAEIRRLLYLSSEETIFAVELLEITQLSFYNKGITDISGIEYLINLEELTLDSNQISNLSPISNLTNLTYLSIKNVKETLDANDLIHLEPLTNLQKLHLSSNDISDLTSISTLTQLTELYFYHCNLTDIAQLSTLSNLRLLDIRLNRITDLTILQTLYDNGAFQHTNDINHIYIYGNYDLNIDYGTSNYAIIEYLQSNGVIIDVELDDFGDSQHYAHEITTNSIIDGKIHPIHDFDYFVFEITETKVITIYTTGVTNTIGSILDNLNNELHQNDDDVDHNFRISVTLEPGIYYIKVDGVTSATGEYQLHVEESDV